MIHARVFNETVERMRIGYDANDKTRYSRWETLKVVFPKLFNFLMVPVSESEILIFSGESQDGFRPCISAFNPKKLELKDLLKHPSYLFSSY